MKIEPVTKEQIMGLVSSISPMALLISGLHEVDVSKGRGVLDDNGKKHCLWTKDGRRITVEVIEDGGVLVSKSKELDPEMPKGGSMSLKYLGSVTNRYGRPP